MSKNCFVILLKCLRQFRGSAITGATGVGKTETVKGLAYTLGRYLALFGCSPHSDRSITYVTLEKPKSVTDVTFVDCSQSHMWYWGLQSVTCDSEGPYSVTDVILKGSLPVRDVMLGNKTVSHRCDGRG